MTQCTGTKAIGSALVVALAGLTACSTTPPAPLPEPVVEFAGAECTNAPDLGLAQSYLDDAKAAKKMMKNRTIRLEEFLGDSGSCLNLDGGLTSPYAVFTIPQSIKGLVINAGSFKDGNSIFAASISVLDKNGEQTREFSREKYRVMGRRYGVQFRPRSGDAFVVISADPKLIGEVSTTQEVSANSSYVSGVNGGGGNNIVGSQKTFNRTFSFDGAVGLRIVFPEQDKKK